METLKDPVGQIGTPPKDAGMRERTREIVGACDQLIRCRNFLWLWSGQLISQFGDGLNRPALLWFVYELTGSAVKMTMIGVLQTIPPLLLGPALGVYLDRLPARSMIRLMIWLDAVRVVLLLLIPTLYVLGTLTLPALYSLVFLIALASMAYGPALNSAIPVLAPASQLTAANAAMQGTATFGMLFGPAISGIGIAFLGVHYVLYANASTFLMAALCKLPIRLSTESSHPERMVTPTGWMDDLRVGLRFVFVRQQIIWQVMVLAALFNLGSTGFIFLLPVIAKDLLQGGPTQLGVIWSALGLGMMLMSAVLIWMTRQELCDRVSLMSSAAVIEGLAIIGLALSQSIVLAVFLVLIIGAGMALVMPIVAAFIQELTPKEILARVFTIFSTGTMASAMVGMSVFGWAADRVGPLSALFALGVLQIIAGFVGLAFTRGCRLRFAMSSATGQV